MTRSAPLLLLLAALLFFFALGNHELQGSTEARVAGIAMAMHLDNDWVVPRLFREPFLEKPPLSLWLDAGAIRLFGGTTWAVRLASAFAGLFSVMLLYGMLRKFGRPKTLAFVAALMLATMASYWSNVRGVGEDSLLTLGVTMALLAFYQANRPESERDRSNLGTWLLFTLGMVIATLSKGVLGLAMPGVVIFVYLASTSLMDKRFKLGDWIKPGLFTLLALVPLMIWLGFLYQRDGLQAVREVLLTNSVGRFSGSFVEAGHYEPFYYYIVKLPEAFLPWNILVYLGLWHFRKSLVRNRYRLFFSVWLVAQFTLLTLASSKRTVYLMALTPAAAVLAAEYAGVLLGWLKSRGQVSNVAEHVYEHRRGLVGGFFTVVVACYLIAAFWFAPKADVRQSFVPVISQIQAMQAQGKEVVLYQANERIAGAGVFYMQGYLTILQTPEELKSYLAAKPGNVALVDNTDRLNVPVTVVKEMAINRQPYYFVEQ
ncbi:glycosyltransferase family 39 protein [Pseudomonas sp. CBSPBW29]|jgi:4-amino-4-deoxy-L-arabinose transferase-like glycosyltransferase|uniref:ArnT family glycosyltransferase n=1 Tax=Pseudomonas TaxID=286 RepID=UPI0021ABFC04|nr:MULTISPECIES: glycosyltransferase family 39 protein [unclassified Pseudomonas]WEL45611.1 glycosyltransferase family 39 protein [Pseudomonas sp. CBSPBW29]WEL66720.1 glycosyltransferase family 39 protein [Pseudomonas sp. CBSPGW29]WEL70207.1 glycosyltransferase family 39 protein [Pseudomonas sp. CBSPCGW29]WEL77161.1 glycosyltransferase family 39 protein [Pseudomonas sp. CBSPAW29]WEL84232.1 glycosyltransferase family 39 protein [Pseudomonas sp. CBSPCAW29]WEL87066.1 glycosyltransferase family 3